MAASSPDITGIELTDSAYFIQQHFLRNAYDIYNSHGTPVLHAKQKLFKMREEFPFTDTKGNSVFTVKAQQVLDIAGDYTLFDAHTEEPFAVLQKDFTIVRHIWHVYDANGHLIADITSRSTFLDLLRSLSNVFQLIPYKYSIVTTDNQRVGEIQELFSVRDKYWVTIQSQGMDQDAREVLITAAIVVDALEGI